MRTSTSAGAITGEGMGETKRGEKRTVVVRRNSPVGGIGRHVGKGSKMASRVEEMVKSTHSSTILEECGETGQL